MNYYPLLAVLLFSAFALYPDSETRSKLDLFIQNSPEWRVEVTKGMAARMNIEERQNIYQKYKKDAVGPFFLNLLLPCAIGSMSQGDNTTALVTLSMDILGWALFLGGTTSLFYFRTVQGSYSHPGTTIFTFAAIPGFGLIAVSFIYKIVAPWVYSGTFNENLERALQLRDSPQSSGKIVPAIAYMPDKDFSLGLAMKF